MNPTFAGAAMTSFGARNNIGSPRPRLSSGELPAVDGITLQDGGIGERTIVVTGFIEEDSLGELEAAIRQMQNYVYTAIVGTFTSTGGDEYPYCRMLSCQHGPISSGGGKYRAELTYRLVQLAATF